MSMKNSNDTTGNRTRDLLTCSAVPQPTAPPRSPLSCRRFVFSAGFLMCLPWYGTVIFNNRIYGSILMYRPFSFRCALKYEPISRFDYVYVMQEWLVIAELEDVWKEPAVASSCWYTEILWKSWVNLHTRARARARTHTNTSKNCRCSVRITEWVHRM